MSGTLYGEAVMNNVLLGTIYNQCVPITEPSSEKIPHCRIRQNHTDSHHCTISSELNNTHLSLSGSDLRLEINKPKYAAIGLAPGIPGEVGEEHMVKQLGCINFCGNSFSLIQILYFPIYRPLQN